MLNDEAAGVTTKDNLDFSRGKVPSYCRRAPFAINKYVSIMVILSSYGITTINYKTKLYPNVSHSNLVL
jgi:hypothetical protein